MKKDKSKLTSKKVRDKNGKLTTVWVRGEAKKKEPSIKALLKTYMENMIKIKEGAGNGKGKLKYSGKEDFVLKNGSFDTAQKFPKAYNNFKGKKKMCFANAFKLASMDSEGLTYVEGYAYQKDIPMVFEHAWVIDKEGKVIDPTWHETQGTTAYYGVKFNHDYIYQKILDTSYYGMLGNAEQGYPLLTGKHTDFGVEKKMTKKEATEFLKWYDEAFSASLGAAHFKTSKPFPIEYPEAGAKRQQAKVILGKHEFQHTYAQMKRVHPTLTLEKYNSVRKNAGIT